MRVILFERRFWEAVVTGEKVHTIRRPRKRQIDPGDRLSLRGWEGKPYRSRQRVLSEETCIAIRDVWIDCRQVVVGDHQFHGEELEAFARSDGFGNFAELLVFVGYHHRLPFSGELIQWGVHTLLKSLGDLRGFTATHQRQERRER